MNKGPQKNPRGSTYTPEVGDRIIAMMAEGKSLRDIAAQPEMPHFDTISDWGNEPKHSDQEFVRRYARAREFGCHAQFEQMREIQDKLLNEEFEKPENARIALDAIKWRLSKMLPRIYGDRQHIEHSGSIKHETVKDHAPEWMQERLALPTAEASEDETVH